MDNYQDEEILDQVECSSDTCKGARRNMSKQLKYSFGDLVVIHLKRTLWKDGSDQKITDVVHFDEQQVLEHKDGPNKTYTLHSVVEHRGKLAGGGHYVTYMKASNGVWLLKDDDDAIEEVTFDRVRNSQALLLFYSLESTIQPGDVITRTDLGFNDDATDGHQLDISSDSVFRM